VVLGRSLQQPVPMVVDRPFLCAVVDGRTGLLLFLGWVADPEPVAA
jgi:serine protease inhibitor